MKPACCDTSFLFSLYGRDEHTPRAKAVLRLLRAPLALTLLNQFEFLAAAELAVFRRVLPAEDSATMRANFEADFASGALILINCNLAAIVNEATRQAVTHTQTGGHRAFDILHVAAALHLNAGEFLSFDRNQRALAAMENLAVRP